MKMWLVLLVVAAFAGVATTPRLQAQSLADSANSSIPAVSKPVAQTDLTYTRPTQKTKLHNYVFDMLGPYPIIGAGFAAGINQVYNTPPEWKQGAEGYGRRFASNFA